MDKYIKLSELYRIVDKYGLKRDIRAKEEIQKNALEAKEDVKSEWIDGFCNKCGYDGGIDCISAGMNFCPYCGADMRGGNAIHE